MGGRAAIIIPDWSQVLNRAKDSTTAHLAPLIDWHWRSCFFSSFLYLLFSSPTCFSTTSARGTQPLSLLEFPPILSPSLILTGHSCGEQSSCPPQRSAPFLTPKSKSASWLLLSNPTSFLSKTQPGFGIRLYAGARNWRPLPSNGKIILAYGGDR